MRRDAEINESADKKRKELIEARNEAESVIYQAEKLVKESGSADASAQSRVNDRISALREKMNGEDAEAIKAGTRELTEAMNALAQAAQAASASQQQNPRRGRAAAGQQRRRDRRSRVPRRGQQVNTTDKQKIAELLRRTARLRNFLSGRPRAGAPYFY